VPPDIPLDELPDIPLDVLPDVPDVPLDVLPDVPDAPDERPDVPDPYELPPVRLLVAPAGPMRLDVPVPLDEPMLPERPVACAGGATPSMFALRLPAGPCPALCVRRQSLRFVPVWPAHSAGALAPERSVGLRPSIPPFDEPVPADPVVPVVPVVPRVPFEPLMSVAPVVPALLPLPVVAPVDCAVATTAVASEIAATIALS